MLGIWGGCHFCNSAIRLFYQHYIHGRLPCIGSEQEWHDVGIVFIYRMILFSSYNTATAVLDIILQNIRLMSEVEYDSACGSAHSCISLLSQVVKF